MDKPQVSLVIPIFNELENIEPLQQQLCHMMDAWDRTTEVVLIDDGSTDGTREKIELLATADTRFKLVLLRRNFGQTAAMQAGIDHAQGEVIVTLDGDLQNDPADIPMMLDHIDEGYDLVHGWRKNRQDASLNRKLPSKIANRLISKVTGFPIHDLGCTLKAIRADIAKELELYGEMHRFIPILAHRDGAKCLEVVTRHRPRIHGETKYGIGRTTRVLLDLMTVKYLLQYFASPMKLFGNIGFMCAALSATFGLGALTLKWMGGMDMTGNPLMLFALVSGLASIQFFSLGLLGEVNARVYYAQHGQRNYKVRSVVNFQEVDQDQNFSVRRAA